MLNNHWDMNLLLRHKCITFLIVQLSCLGLNAQFDTTYLNLNPSANEVLRNIAVTENGFRSYGMAGVGPNAYYRVKDYDQDANILDFTDIINELPLVGLPFPHAVIATGDGGFLISSAHYPDESGYSNGMAVKFDVQNEMAGSCRCLLQ